MRARVGDDRVGGHRHVVAARRGDGTHRGDDRLARLAQPNHLAPDGFRAGDRAAGAVDPQHDRGDVVVGARLAQRRGDGVAAGAGGAQRGQLPSATTADDGPGQGHHGDGRLGLAARQRRRRTPGAAAGRSGTGTAAAARRGRPARHPVRQRVRRSGRRPRRGNRCGRRDGRRRRRRAAAAPCRPARRARRARRAGTPPRPRAPGRAGSRSACRRPRGARRCSCSSVNMLAADLYSPRAMNCAWMPALSSASRRNSALVAKPTSPTVPDGCIHTSRNADAR